MKRGNRIEMRLSLPGFLLDVVASWDATALAIFGPSGSGKTSVLEILAGIRRADSAKLILQGRVLEDSSAKHRVPADRRDLGWVPQDASLFPHLTVAENLRFGLRRAGSTTALEAAVEILEIGSLLGRRPAEISGGERQRVALARALASGPRALLLDEPLASLDLPLRSRIFPYLLRLRDATRLPMIYVTHDAGEALALAEHVLVLDDGRAVASGSPEELLRVPAALRLLDLVRLENRMLVARIKADPAGDLARVRTTGGLDLAVPHPFPARAGEAIGVRADEVILATASIEGISAQNRLPGRIEGITEQEGRCLVAVRCGEERLVAAVTRRAVADLDLGPGKDVTVLFKATAIHRVVEESPVGLGALTDPMADPAGREAACEKRDEEGHRNHGA